MVLQAADSSKNTPVREIITELKRFHAGRSLDGLSIRKMIGKGKR